MPDGIEHASERLVEGRVVAEFYLEDGSEPHVTRLIDALNALAMADDNLYAWDIEEDLDHGRK